jgi:hypothetical protein
MKLEARKERDEAYAHIHELRRSAGTLTPPGPEKRSTVEAGPLLEDVTTDAWRTWARDVLGVEPGSMRDDELRKRLSAELSRRPEKLGYVLCPDCSPEPDGLVARPGAIIGGRVCCWRCGMAAVAVNESTKGEVEA